MVVDICITLQEELELADLGIDTPSGGSTAKFRFPTNKFSGYWIDPDDQKIHFVVDGYGYIALYNEKLEREFNRLSSLQ